MDYIYTECVSFLEDIRPGGERLVDQLLIDEEIAGKDLRSVAREYISALTSLEVLNNSRQSSLFDIMTPELEEPSLGYLENGSSNKPGLNIPRNPVVDTVIIPVEEKQLVDA